MHEKQGNFNHPVQIARVPGESFASIAFQNYEDEYGQLAQPEEKAPTALPFTATRSEEPVFLYKLVGTKDRKGHWGGHAPGSVVKNVAIGRWENGKHFMVVGSPKTRRYELGDITSFESQQ